MPYEYVNKTLNLYGLAALACRSVGSSLAAMLTR
jgi:hypothetical protein